jgi:iron complex transport system permease protein
MKSSAHRNLPVHAFELLLCVFLAILIVLSLQTGVYHVGLGKTCRILWALVTHANSYGAGWTATDQIVIQIIRLPRVILAVLAGAGLALGGACLQGLMRNPLVAPDIVGVTPGALAGGVCAICLGASSPMVTVSAFAGGLVALLLATILARISGEGLLPMILSGIVVGTCFSSMVTLALLLSDPTGNLPRVLFWIFGSFSGADRAKVISLAIPSLIAGGLLLSLRWRLNLLSLGEDDARALGLKVQRWRWAIIILVSMIVSAQVAVSGAVGWVGLIVPHAGRMFVGSDHRRLLPVTAMLGAIFVLGVDDLARTITQTEVPIGLLMSFIGAPLFATLLWKHKARGWAHE